MAQSKERLRLVKRRKHGSTYEYFTQEHENAILNYNSTIDQREKDKIYEKYIYPSFITIVDNLINVYKLNYMQNIEEVKNDCVSSMTEKIVLYNPELGYKAFSFFSVVAKNWLLQYAKKYKKNYSIFEEDENVHIHVELRDDVEEKLAMQEEAFGQIDFYIKRMEEKIRKNTILYKVFVGVCVFLVSSKNYSYSSYNRKAMIDFVSSYTGIDRKRVMVALYRLKKKM